MKATPPILLGPASEVLATEIATYRRELPQLLASGQAGRYAVIKGQQVLSIWTTQTEALQDACARFGLDPFAVKKIDPRDVERFQRLDTPREAACQP